MKADQLRKSILQMAIQGKLVPQDPNDEPASVLLEKIRAEKEKLIKQGKIKKDKNDSVIFKGEDGKFYEKIGKIIKDITEHLPFEIPDSWVWIKHNEIFEISGGSQPPKSKFVNEPQKGYIRLYQIRDYGSNPQPIYIPENTASKVSKKGDILLARYGASLGKVFWAEAGAYNVAMAKAIPLFDISLIEKSYLYFFYKSSIYQEIVMGNARSAQAGFNKEDLSKMFFPLPPFNEQKRIVKAIKKFQPLLAEYDKLEQQATKLDSEIFDKIKKSVLQYAIQGKLVPQDSSDEPASVLLAKIKAEKESLIKQGKIKKEKPLPPITDDEKPFDIPDSWEWVRLNDLISVLGDGIHGTPQFDENGNCFFINGNNLIKGCIVFKSDTKKVSEIEYQKYKKPLDKNTILISINGTIGNYAFFNDESVILGKSACYFSLLNSIDKKYICKLLNTQHFIDYAVKEATQTTIKNVSLKAMRLLPVPLPPLNEQKRIVARIEKIFEILEDFNLQYGKSM